MMNVVNLKFHCIFVIENKLLLFQKLVIFILLSLYFFFSSKIFFLNVYETTDFLSA